MAGVVMVTARDDRLTHHLSETDLLRAGKDWKTCSNEHRSEAMFNSAPELIFSTNIDLFLQVI